MTKYRVYGYASASKVVATVEANSKEEAITKAENDPDSDYYMMLCHQCAGKVELGDVYELKAEEIDE